MKFLKCEQTGSILLKAFYGGKNDTLTVLESNTVDAAVEKHVPVVEVSGNKVSVKVGSVEHPMTEAHYITFIALETKKCVSVWNLDPTDAPEATFVLTEGDEPVAVYEYCNLHGLWKAEL